MTNKLPFSPFIESNGLIFLSGQVYLTPEGKLLEGTIEEKTHQVMKNLEKVLNDAGVDFNNIVKTTIFVTDMSIYAKVNEVYASYFEGPCPARETVCVKELPLSAEIEISMIASKN